MPRWPPEENSELIVRLGAFSIAKSILYSTPPVYVKPDKTFVPTPAYGLKRDKTLMSRARDAFTPYPCGLGKPRSTQPSTIYSSPTDVGEVLTKPDIKNITVRYRPGVAAKRLLRFSGFSSLSSRSSIVMVVSSNMVCRECTKHPRRIQAAGAGRAAVRRHLRCCQRQQGVRAGVCGVCRQQRRVAVGFRGDMCVAMMALAAFGMRLRRCRGQQGSAHMCGTVIVDAAPDSGR